MEDPLRTASYPDGVRPLDDYLFHAFLRMARDLDLPVQLHTGHLAGLYGDIRQANAAVLANLLMLHRDVRFDLFHANWPYSGELLFLAKAYPNVSIDFCWTNIIDPIYSQDIFRQALSSVPHSKIHGYGSDFGGFGYPPGGGYVDRAWAHAQIARENVAIALSEMVEIEYLSLNDAQEVAEAWLFSNANEFYRLGL
jgi:predicted TIM-barrel fold metal-dependent hydrolase